MTPGAEAQRPGVGGEVGQGHERVEHRQVRPGRRRRHRRVGQDVVLAGPHALPPGVLGRPGDADGGRRVGGADVDVDEEESELHAITATKRLDMRPAKMLDGSHDDHACSAGRPGPVDRRPARLRGGGASGFVHRRGRGDRLHAVGRVPAHRRARARRRGRRCSSAFPAASGWRRRATPWRGTRRSCSRRWTPPSMRWRPCAGARAGGCASGSFATADAVLVPDGRGRAPAHPTRPHDDRDRGAHRRPGRGLAGRRPRRRRRQRLPRRRRRRHRSRARAPVRRRAAGGAPGRPSTRRPSRRSTSPTSPTSRGSRPAGSRSTAPP